jgi:probable HAF family extracellular repeat protein
MTTYLIDLLGSPPAQTTLGSGATALNNGGAAVGWVSIPEPHAVLWNPSGPVVLLSELVEGSSAYSINDSGDIIGAAGLYSGSLSKLPFLYRNGVMQMHKLDSLFEFAKTKKIASIDLIDINNSGLIAGWWATYGGLSQAFLYDSQAMKPPILLGVLPGHDTSQAWAVNNKGQVAGISTDYSAQETHAFLYDGGLNDLGTVSTVSDINDAGQIVGARVFDGTNHHTAYLRETSGGPQQFQDLGPLPLPGFVTSYARAINNQGDIVGTSGTLYGSGDMERVFVRPVGGQMQDLNSLLVPGNSGWLLQSASAINDLGQIAGTGVYYGKKRAYLLTPSDVDVPAHEIRDWAAIDPLALALTNQVYVTLTLPDPPPFDRLMAQVRTQIRAMGPEVRKHALERLKAIEADVKTLEKELRKR